MVVDRTRPTTVSCRPDTWWIPGESSGFMSEETDGPHGRRLPGKPLPRLRGVLSFLGRRGPLSIGDWSVASYITDSGTEPDLGSPWWGRGFTGTLVDSGDKDNVTSGWSGRRGVSSTIILTRGHLERSQWDLRLRPLRRDTVTGKGRADPGFSARGLGSIFTLYRGSGRYDGRRGTCLGHCTKVERREVRSRP